MRYRVPLLIVLFFALQGLVLAFMGQPLICTCGAVDLWHGVVLSAGNSQHLTDWYTFSHIIHGLLFYAALHFLFPRMPLLARLCIAVGIEVGWELLENTPWLIEHYRQQALAQGYVGDSVLNSLSDTFAMLLGFFAAARLPTAVSVALGLSLEAVALYGIRDSLVLNIVGFFHDFEFISTWQSGPR